MNSARTRKRPVFLTVLLLLFLTLCLTACDVDTVPEIIAGRIIRSIIESDYDLIYGAGDETENIPDYTQPSWESPESVAEEGGENGSGTEEEAPEGSGEAEDEAITPEEDSGEEEEEEEEE
ncbi:MAG: hypothetical protein IJU87_04490, partial [Lachnospiraceae bacterium]|nr:hypothetical protein [Lachnospiraceae bacterium]